MDVALRGGSPEHNPNRRLHYVLRAEEDRELTRIALVTPLFSRHHRSSKWPRENAERSSDKCNQCQLAVFNM